MLPFGYGRLDIDVNIDKPSEGDAGYLTQEETEDVLNASLIYKTELAAMAYIARAEQSSFGLTQKLIKKGYTLSSIKVALDYLKSVNYLNDERFASAWIRTRCLNHVEGKNKLLAELMSRGIDKETAQKALDDFFCDKDELEMCAAAYRKCIRTVKDEQKIYSSLMRKGFSYSQIKQVIQKSEDII